MMTRREQIEKAAEDILNEPLLCSSQYSEEVKASFRLGAVWADKNPSKVVGEVIGALNNQASDFEERWRKSLARVKRLTEALDWIAKQSSDQPYLALKTDMETTIRQARKALEGE